MQHPEYLKRQVFKPVCNRAVTESSASTAEHSTGSVNQYTACIFHPAAGCAAEEAPPSSLLKAEVQFNLFLQTMSLISCFQKHEVTGKAWMTTTTSLLGSFSVGLATSAVCGCVSPLLCTCILCCHHQLPLQEQIALQPVMFP